MIRVAEIAGPAGHRLWRAWSNLRRVVTERSVRGVRMLGGLLLAVTALAVLLWYQQGYYERTTQARGAALAAANESVVKVMSYNFRTIDRQVAQTRDLLGGEFRQQYAELMNGTLVRAAKTERLAIQTAVDHSSVVSSSPDHVVLLMFIDQQSEADLTPEPAMTSSRLRVAMDQDGGRWVVSEITPV
jgi:Mce-associated membrane protein